MFGSSMVAHALPCATTQAKSAARGLKHSQAGRGSGCGSAASLDAAETVITELVRMIGDVGLSAALSGAGAAISNVQVGSQY